MTPSTGSSTFPTYVALVPLEAKPDNVNMDDLVAVAAALQIQVVRDLHPVWGVSAAVVPFASFEEMPNGYIPLAVTDLPLPLHRSGFHFALDGLPFAVVEYRANREWSLAASHELLEMLCDPDGQRIVLAPSLQQVEQEAIAADLPESQPGDHDADKPRGKGFREDADKLYYYFREVCDPCEYSTYKINGIVVSDFVTPSYYHIGPPWHDSYSFLHRVKRPLEVLQGGYISWRKHPPSALIYQASAHKGEADLRAQVFAGHDPNVKSVSERELRRQVVGGSSRFSVDAQQRTHSEVGLETREPPGLPQDRPTQSPQAVLREDINELLRWLNFQANAKEPDLGTVITVLKELVDSHAVGESYADPSRGRSQLHEALGVPQEQRRDPSDRISLDALRDVLAYLEAQEGAEAEFGSGGAPVLGLWLAVQIG